MATITALQTIISFKQQQMIYLNYTNLDAVTQESLLERAKNEIEKAYGVSLSKYAKENQLVYESLLEEEAIRKLYTYTYVFSI